VEGLSFHNSLYLPNGHLVIVPTIVMGYDGGGIGKTASVRSEE
jgi:hypothetical protein